MSKQRPSRNRLDGISYKNLPELRLHGFTPSSSPTSESLDGTLSRPTVGSIKEYIEKLPPLYTEKVYTRNEDNEIVEQERDDLNAVDQGYMGLNINDPESEYFRSDLDADLNLSKFMISCSWETMTTAPYANAHITLAMPSALTNFLFHGEPADATGMGPKVGSEQIKRQSGFRFIEAGGWASIRFNKVYEEVADNTQNFRTVFFGKIISINIRTSVAEGGVFNSMVSLTLGSFIQPLTTSHAVKTPRRIERIQDVDPAAIGSYNVKDNVLLKGLKDQIKSVGAGTFSMYSALRYFIKSLGYMELPPDLGGYASEALKKPVRLGDNIFLIGEYEDTAMNTIYELNAADMNTVQGKPLEEYYTSLFTGSNKHTCWAIIQQMFQPSNSFIELFPVIIPLPPNGSSLSRASGGGGTHVTGPDGVVSDDTPTKNTHLTDKLQADLYIMYRYKPMPPTFFGDKDSVNANNQRTGGLRARVENETYHEKFFGSPGEAAHVFGLEQRPGGSIPSLDPDGGRAGVELSLVDRGLHKPAWTPEFVYINEQSVVSMDLTWNELDRVNAVNMGMPYKKGSAGEMMLFGIECVPVFNQHDINRHGLRMVNEPTPFVSNAKDRQSLSEFNSNASSGTAERLYYLVGEGHAYATGRISMTYTPNPDLTAGIWCAIYFREGNGDGLVTNLVVGSGSSDDKGSKPLTFYVTAVTHEVRVEPTTGQFTGNTALTIERASYGCRIPSIAVSQVQKQGRPPKPVDDGRRPPPPKRRTNRRRRRGRGRRR